jgi:hypothetical protein
MMDYVEQQREAAAIRADIYKANALIRDARARYVKERTRARSKRQAEETATLFADLGPYGSKREIQDHYGWGGITLAEMDRLLRLWDLREDHAKGGEPYCDRVTDMLDKAAYRLVDDYIDFLDDADREAAKDRRNQQGRF